MSCNDPLGSTHHFACDCREAQFKAIQKERDAARETNARLNRRCQEYERGLREKLDGAKGSSLGRGLANAAAAMYQAEAEKAEQERDEARAEAARWKASRDKWAKASMEDGERLAHAGVRLKQERDSALSCVARLRDALGAAMDHVGDDEIRADLRADLVDAEGLLASREPDLDLLRKLASGEGGRRTGALMRAGLIKIEVTEAGRAALDEVRRG